MKNLLVVTLAIVTCILVPAQVGIGHWQTFQSFGLGSAVAVKGTTVFCGTDHGLYSYNYSNTEMQEYTKPQGYVGLGVKGLGYSPKANAVIVCYEDANIDIIKNNEIINLPQVKNYNIIGDKTLNNITISGDSAIISCGFGVVVVDLRLEIIKTDVKFSDNLAFASANCYDAAIFNGNYYFATSQGMYRVPYNSNIKDLSNWTALTGINAGIYNNVSTFNGTLYFSYSNYLTNALDNSDVIYSSDGTTSNVYMAGWNARINDITANNGRLAFLSNNEVRCLDANSNPLPPITGCFDRTTRVDIDAETGVWVSQVGAGLICYKNGECSIHAKDGPFSKNVWDIDIVNGDVWVASGGVNVSWGNAYIVDKIYYRRNNDWKWFNIPDYGYYEPHTDIFNIVADPSIPGHIYAGSWGTGLYEGQNYLPSTQFLSPNLDSTSVVTSLTYRVGGMVMDAKSNLWFTNSHTGNPLKVKRKNGTWGTYTLNGVNNSNTVTKIEIDNRNQLWIAVEGKGILVRETDGNGTPGPNQRMLTSTFNQGDLPSLNVRALECDKDGQMWVGTHDGIRIFSPSQVFNSSNGNINGQKIVIKDDEGINELLLKETIINDIETDGANRKWIATMGTGVRLVSSDGREIIHSFTAENSPLLSNNVYCVAIDDKSGEVFFGTDQGICVFRSDATAADDTFGNVYAFPNPVKPGYDGPVAITGMAENSIVKITDIAGNLMYETKSEGGQAIWNGKKYDGKRPSTGVYLVFCVNEDASQTVVTKILFVN